MCCGYYAFSRAPTLAILTGPYRVRGALQASARKIAIFLMSVGTIVVVVGTLMFTIVSAQHGLTNIPVSVYWAVATLTTVGYGEIAPRTAVNRFSRRY